ncbi:hypothetical protein ACYU03_16315 [Pseudomonas sp. X10]
MWNSLVEYRIDDHLTGAFAAPHQLHHIYVTRLFSPSKRKTPDRKWRFPMADNSFLTAVVTAVLTSMLTLLGTNYQQSRQEARDDASRFLDAAHATVQESIVILDDGYNALDKLISATQDTGWKAFSKGAWLDYMAFQRRWHQRMIAQHFKLARYFGKDMADTLIDLDYIPIGPTSTVNADEGKAVSPYNIQKLAADVEYQSRSITVLQGIADEAMEDKGSGGVMDTFNAIRQSRNDAYEMLANYDKGTINLLKSLDERLTQLGARKVTVVNLSRQD